MNQQKSGFDDSPALTVLDWIGVVVTLLMILFVAVGIPIAAPQFEQMFAEFGAAIPALTQLCIKPALGIVAIFPTTLVVLALGPMRHSRIAVRRALIVAAFVLALTFSGLWLLGVYLPIFDVAGAVGA